ncbi:MAG: GyrI-like domain-containing protein, partial [Chlorobia bacterium]|nr:GyrI-like domain-containing protein [Fimbriimonadaceae bacterium]
GFRSGLRECPGIQTRNGLHFYEGGFTKFRLVDRGGIPMKLEVIDMPAKRLAGVRHIGPYHEIGAAFGELGQKAGPLGLIRKPKTMMIGVYFDDPATTPVNELQSIAAITVEESDNIGDLAEAELPPGKYLQGEFVGHYSGLGEAWDQFYGKQIAEGGYTLRDGACFEVYVSDHDSTPPDELVTHLYAPIA